MNEVSPHLTEETKITWLEDPSRYPYVREKVERHDFRSRFPIRQYSRNPNTFKLLGYSEISLTAEQINDGFYRRIWYVKLPNDPYARSSPWEAVKPSSILPGQPSAPGRE